VLAHQFDHQPIDALARLHLRLHDAIKTQHRHRAHDAALKVLAQALQERRRRRRVGQLRANRVHTGELRVRANQQPMLGALRVQVQHNRQRFGLADVLNPRAREKVALLQHGVQVQAVERDRFRVGHSVIIRDAV
jgi:hypothetical protein